MRLLLVEDDPLLGEGLKIALSEEGYAVDWFKDGRQALAAIKSESFTAVVLDLGLPGLDGVDLLRQMRQKKIATPVLVLTARHRLSDKIQGLDLGADDYLTKPFDIEELLARLRAIIRRSQGQAQPQLVYQDLVLDPASHEVYKAGQRVNLSKKEFAILHYLLLHRSQVISPERLQEQIYGWDTELESNALQVHIYHLRKKIGKEIIQTIRGIGYKIA